MIPAIPQRSSSRNGTCRSKSEKKIKINDRKYKKKVKLMPVLKQTNFSRAFWRHG